MESPAFEEVNVVLIKAGVFSEVDRVTGVSSNVMLGQVAPCGTGDCDVLMDHVALHYGKSGPRPTSGQRGDRAPAARWSGPRRARTWRRPPAFPVVSCCAEGSDCAFVKKKKKTATTQGAVG